MDMTSIKNIRHGGQVKRYHTWDMLREQTVAAHSWGVGHLLYEFYKPDFPPARLLLAALFHDVAEGFTGDTPAPVKREFPEIWKQLHIAEAVVEERMGLTPVMLLSDKEKLLLKLADILELTIFGMEDYKRGNKNAIAVIQNGLQYSFDLFQAADTIMGEEPEVAAAVRLYDILKKTEERRMINDSLI